MPRDRTPEGQNGWRRGMRALASHPHVSVKISGFGMFDPAWTVDSIRPFVRTTIDLFGVERCMFASNFPVDKVFRSYAEVYEAFDTLTADLSARPSQTLWGQRRAHLSLVACW
jgi:predicted TIM-barrel fold metal-dependent hydrolase